MKNGNSEYKIESRIPIPSVNRGRPNGGLSQALRDLKKGQSVFVRKPLQQVSHNTYSIARELGRKGMFTCRSMDGGTRIWRVK